MEAKANNRLEAKALKRYIRSSPRKMRLVIDLIRGKSVEEALVMLKFTPKHAAQDAEKVLKSAKANLIAKNEGITIDASDMYVSRAFVDQGPVAKRVLPAPMGRAYRVRKRSHHLTIIVSSKY